MPITIHERGQAFEAKFARDEEFRFRLTARRDKLFARWVAATLRLSGETGEAFVKSVLAIPDGAAHDQVLLAHVTDFASARGMGGLREGLAAALDRCAEQAFAQLTAAPVLGLKDQP